MNYLLIDFGSTFTKLIAVDINKNEVLATAKAITTVNTNILTGFNKAYKLLEAKTGNINYHKKIACSSAAGGLKMCAIGLIPELTTEAAKQVCLGAGAKVELVFSHHLTNSELETLENAKIDIILLAGGADGGNSETVIFNAQKLSERNLKIPIIFAGNKAARDEVEEIFKKAHLNYYLADNVMPKINKLNITSAQDKIKEIFLTNIIEAKGIKKAQEEIDEVIMPTPNAVMLAGNLLSKYYGDLMIFDIGGATTDVYSFAEGEPKALNVIKTGLEDPYQKRTVEGDIGMRYSLMGVMPYITKTEINEFFDKDIDILVEIEKRVNNIEFLPKTKKDMQIENFLAKKCVEIGMSRHVGTIKSIYTPEGLMFEQKGKDLTDVKMIIGTGGIITSSNNSLDILKLEQVPQELRPKTPNYYIDTDYILQAIGLLSIYHEDIALEIIKKHLKPLGDNNATTK